MNVAVNLCALLPECCHEHVYIVAMKPDALLLECCHKLVCIVAMNVAMKLYALLP